MIFHNFRKKRAIKSYINKLGHSLAKRYGRRKLYTSGQVERTVHDEGYNWRHICYAHALYTSFKQFHKWHDERGESCDYEGMRAEITNDYFGGNSSVIESGSFCSGAFDSSSGSDGGSGE